MPNVLGVDPGSYTTEWSLVEGAGRLPRLVDCGEIRLATRLSFPERLHLLRSEFEAIVCRLLPDAAGVESPFHGPSARAALQLPHARGVILAVLAMIWSTSVRACATSGAMGSVWTNVSSPRSRRRSMVDDNAAGTGSQGLSADDTDYADSEERA